MSDPTSDTNNEFGTIRPMSGDDIDSCTELVKVAMDAKEGEYARSTFNFHFDCALHQIDDGRRLYVCESEGKIWGIVGLHFYVWGPPENIWLGWFAVDPQLQGRGLGAWMLESVTKLAYDLGHRKIFIETYSSPTFDRAVRFYRRQGFTEAGRIEDYLPDGSAMIVFSKRI